MAAQRWSYREKKDFPHTEENEEKQENISPFSPTSFSTSNPIRLIEERESENKKNEISKYSRNDNLKKGREKECEFASNLNMTTYVHNWFAYLYGLVVSFYTVFI